MTAVLRRFAADERGVAAIEYGLIAGLISVVIITALQVTGVGLNTKFKAISAALK